MAPISVLIIDDDAALLRMLRLAMISAGMEASVAHDGVDGLEIMETKPFDAIVLDLQMPRMDGRAFYREMTHRGYDPQVVILSAFKAEEARRELKAAAALPKPFDPDVLVDTVRRVVASARPGESAN